VQERRAVDLAVVDQVRGPTSRVGWLEFARVVYGESGGEVGICWLGRGPRSAGRAGVPPSELAIATPAGSSPSDEAGGREEGAAPGSEDVDEHDR
jgi:hypothetical protein